MNSSVTDHTFHVKREEIMTPVTQDVINSLDPRLNSLRQGYLFQANKNKKNSNSMMSTNKDSGSVGLTTGGVGKNYQNVDFFKIPEPINFKNSIKVKRT